MSESFEIQGDEQKTKNFRLPCSRFDTPTVEAWLNEKSSDGWHFYAWEENDITLSFTRDGQSAERYWVEPAWEDAAPTTDEQRRYEMLGWEFVCRSHDGIYHVWRAAVPGARKGRLKQMEDSYAYRKVKKSLRHNYLWLLAVIALLLAAAWFIRIRSPYVVWRLVADAKIGFDIFSFALSMVGTFWVDRREREAMQRLKRSLAEGEEMRGVGRTGIVGKIVQRLPLVVAAVLLLSVAGGNVDSYFHDIHGYDADPVPFIAAETLGGTASEECYVETRHTLLGGEITLVSEGKYVGAVENYLWVQYTTQLEVYAPQLKFLAKPLANDVYAQYFKYCEAEILDNTDAEKAYYSHDIHDTQRLLLCDGGVVLYYRTSAPDDLRAHLDEFTALLRQYQND